MENIMLLFSELALSPFTYILLALVYWCVDKRAGQLMAFNVASGSWFNQWFKKVWKIERPWVRDSRIIPSEAALTDATGYSFPSGHTARAVANYGALGYAVRRRNKVASILLWVFVALVMLSRNYLGVHTFLDVLVSLLVGIVFIFLCDYVLRWVDKGDTKVRISRDILVCIIGCIIFFIPMLRYGCLGNAGASFGFLIGWVLERRFVNFKCEGALSARICRFVMGAMIVWLAINSGSDFLIAFMPSRYTGFFVQGFVSFYIIFLYPFVFNACENLAFGEKTLARNRLIVCIVAVIVLLFGSILTLTHTGALAGIGDYTDVESVSWDGIQVIAHRGYSAEAPENTLAAFRAAMDIDADMIELDVQETSDGVIVVFHDTDMARITSVSGQISDYTYDELCQLSAGAWFNNARTGLSYEDMATNYASEKIPTLSEVLELIRDDDIELYVELKDMNGSSLSDEAKAAFPYRVMEVVNASGLSNRIIYGSFNYDYLMTIEQADEANKTLFITSIGDADILINSYPCEYYGINVDTLQQSTIQKLHDDGATVYIWTVNNTTQMINSMNLGADGLITNYPGMARVVVHKEYEYLTSNCIATYTLPKLYDFAQYDQYCSYIVQGMTIGGGYMVVSAYDKSGENNSILYVMNSAGVLTGVVDLGFMAHTGGIAYDEERDILWVTGSEGTVNALRWSEIISGTYNGDILYTFDAGLYNHNGGHVASFITLDDGKLYVGSYCKEMNGLLNVYDINNLLTYNETTPETVYEIPDCIQGATFARNGITGTVTMLLSQSADIQDAHLLSVVLEEGRTDYSSVDNAWLLPEGAEQINMTANGLYILFESAVRPYRATCRVPNDQIWLISEPSL